MNEDTILLLQEVNAGCKAATNSIEQVMQFTQKQELRNLLYTVNKEHVHIGDACHKMLNRVGVSEKDPSLLAKSFSWITTETKMLLDNSTKKIAGIMLDGCHMGIKSVAGYLNQYQKADEDSKNLAHKLIDEEMFFMQKLLAFL